MKAAIIPGPGGDGWWLPLAEDATPLSPAEYTPDLAATVAGLEARERPRWIWPETARLYPALLAAGVRVHRCHDVVLTEAILLGFEGEYGQPHSVAAAHARLLGVPVAEEAPPEHAPRQATLFDDDAVPATADRADLDVLVAVYAAQLRRIAAAAATPEGRGLGLLCAAESAGGLVAAEMTSHGLPWRLDVHDALLTEMLGPRPVAKLRPRRLQRLADEITAAFGRPVNPDSPQQLLAAFKAAGMPVESTRSWVLKKLPHPVVAPLLEYKELARVHAAHGWSWADQWVSGGRFRPEYVVGGVVSGRWATNGGGALQIPKAVRGAVTADDGWRLIVADAAQLEPRVLAAMSRDAGMARAAGAEDLYAALSGDFGGKRESAKIALLSAMYGGGSADAMTLLAVMRQRFGAAYAYVEEAARDGERGRLVRTWLGRTCPPPSSRWKAMGAGPEATRAVRDRGRFTRNFVVQGTAAEWALAWLAFLRNRLHEKDLGELVFFQHDEVIVHSPESRVGEAAEAVQEAADEATRLLFCGTPVRIPLSAKAVASYAEAK